MRQPYGQICGHDVFREDDGYYTAAVGKRNIRRPTWGAITRAVSRAHNKALEPARAKIRIPVHFVQTANGEFTVRNGFFCRLNRSTARVETVEGEKIAWRDLLWTVGPGSDTIVQRWAELDKLYRQTYAPELVKEQRELAERYAVLVNCYWGRSGETQLIEALEAKRLNHE